MLQQKISWRGVAVAAAALALTALAACSENTAPQAEAAPPPPPAAVQAPPPELLGGPPPPEREFTPMAPIANPEDLPPAERMRVYGYLKMPHHYVRDWDTSSHDRIHTVVKAGQPATVVKPAATPVAASVPSPVKAAPPVVTATVVPNPVVLTPAQQLQAAAVGSAKSAALTVPADLSATKPGKVTLSLPAGLFKAIHDAAVKLGLAKATRNPQVTATLNGDGYIITPNGPQTAPLKAGQPTTFTWQVLPTPTAKGPLSVDMSVILKGLKSAESFSLGKLEQTVSSVEAAVAAATAKSKTSDGIDLPGFGRVPSKTAIFVIIAVLALLILAVAGRMVADRRAASDRRRKAAEAVIPVVAPGPVAAADPAVARVVAEPAAADPVVDHVVAEPATAAPVVEPPAAEPHTPEPVVEHIVAEHAPADPVVEHVVTDPVTSEPVAEHVMAEPAAAEPVVEQVVAKSEAAEPVVDNIVAETASAQPVAERVDSEPPPLFFRRQAAVPVPAQAPEPHPVVERVSAEVARVEMPAVHEENHALALEPV